MENEINDENFDSIIEKISKKSGLSNASARNLLTLNDDSDLAEKLNVKPSAINRIFYGEADSTIAEIFNLTSAELQNLMDDTDL